MKVLILGSSGILGHALFVYLSEKTELEIYGIVSINSKAEKFYQKYKKVLRISDLLDFNLLIDFISDLKPDFVINCAVKKNFNESSILNNILVNSCLPHQMNELSIAFNFRFIHISTDSIFGNDFSNKSETDSIEVKDLYSATKFLGEPNGDNTLVLRTSIIGHSLTNKDGFFDHVRLSNVFRGYSNVFFSGTTTLELAKIIYSIVSSPNKISGVYHVAGKEISKLNLAKLIAEVYSLDIQILDETEVKSRRILLSVKFDEEFLYKTPSWVYLLNNQKDFYNLNADIYE